MNALKLFKGAELHVSHYLWINFSIAETLLQTPLLGVIQPTVLLTQR